MPRKIKKSGERSYLLTVSAGYDSRGKQITHSKTVQVSGEREAKKQYGLFLAEIDKGQIATSGKMTLTEFYNYYEQHYSAQTHQPGTMIYNRNIFARIKDAMGHMRLDKIEPRHILSFYKNLAEPGIKKVQCKKNATSSPVQKSLHPNTIRKYHSLLRALFEKAVRWQFIPFSPVDKVTPPKAVHTTKDVYSNEQTSEFFSLLEHEPTKYQLLCSLAFGLGARREEIFGLEWKDVDFDKQRISINRSSIYVHGIGIITGPTKNIGSLRNISAPSTTMQLLSQYEIEQNEVRLKLGDQWQNHGRIFTKWNGEPAHPHSFYEWLTRFARKHNLPKISPHCFRHLSISYLILAGVDIKTISDRTGQRLTSTIAGYSHILNKNERQTANLLDNVLKRNNTSESEKQEQA